MTFRSKRYAELLALPAGARPDLSTIGARLRAARRAANLSQQQVSDVCGLCRASIRAYEAGTRSPTLACAIDLAAHLGVPLQWLATGDAPVL